MYRIAIIGPKTCQKTKEVKEFLFKVKQTFGNTCTILSGGNDDGIEKDVKKFCFQFELSYQEFNPSYTGYNLYSALGESYYKKGYHPTHFLHRYEEMLRRTDRLVLGFEEGNNFKLYEQIRKKAEKMKIKTVLI